MKKRIVLTVSIVLSVLIVTPVMLFMFINMPRILPRPLYIDDTFEELAVSRSENDTRSVITVNNRAGTLTRAVYEEDNGLFIPGAVSEDTVKLSAEDIDRIVETVNGCIIPVHEVETFGELDGKHNTLLLSPRQLIATSTRADNKIDELYDELESVFRSKMQY